MCHHALGQFFDLAGAPDRGLCQKTFRLRPVESWMHSGNIVERLRNFYPARQDGDIGQKADIAHQLVAISPRVAAQHLQLSLIRGKAEDRVERGGLAGAVGTDKSQDVALFHTQINAVQCDRCAEDLADAACFDTCHGSRASPLLFWNSIESPQIHPAVLPPSARAAE